MQTAYRSPETAKAALPRFSTGLKWMQLVFCFVGMITMAVMMFSLFEHVANISHSNRAGAKALPSEAFFEQMLGGMVGFVIALTICMFGAITSASIWVGQVWSWLPEEERRAKGWTGPVSPLMASGLGYIPTFQFVWAIMLLFGLQNAFTHMREVFGRPRKTERANTLGILAVVFAFTGFLPIASIFAFMTMSDIEKQIEEIREASVAYAAGGMPLAALPQGYRSLVAGSNEENVAKARAHRSFMKNIAGIATVAFMFNVLAPVSAMYGATARISAAMKNMPKNTAPVTAETVSEPVGD